MGSIPVAVTEIFDKRARIMDWCPFFITYIDLYLSIQLDGSVDKQITNQNFNKWPFAGNRKRDKSYKNSLIRSEMIEWFMFCDN